MSLDARGKDVKETGQDKEFESFDNFWDDEPRDRRPGPAPRRLSQFVLGGFAAVLVVLLMVFMFSDREPPEKSRNGAQSELVIPLDSPVAADDTGNSGQQPVPPLAAAPEDGEPFVGAQDGGAPITADGSLASANTSQSAMDVRRDAPQDAPQPAQAARPASPPVPYELGMAPRPAARPEAVAPKAAPADRNDAGKAIPVTPGEPVADTGQANPREAGLQARLARESAQAAQPAAATPAVSDKEARVFLVQLGAFKARENADKLLQSLGSTGNLKLHVVEDAARGVYKVQSGPYAEATEARQAREQIMRQAGNIQPIILPVR
ncbi:SPOR domain-containing protein [Thermithiobacillus plumbiphilus]|uniref:SPOR domain-containing protein n=1 Tax=Thermithiobacillus plumbiphilus TaxID=1729899 RepID=A0ABU9D631_9PROT